jgi:hypothetical protein
METVLTVIVHGTFAAEEKWWRLGTDGEKTFADRLEQELSLRGASGTVWNPELVNRFDYSLFTWSGRNRHRDRVKAARGLSRTLNHLAQHVEATPREPLTVNFVAHSHGGNVVLEALRHIGPNVRIGRIALLGTPLITARPAFRIARFVFSTILLALAFVCFILLITEGGSLLFTGQLYQSTRLIEKEAVGCHRLPSPSASEPADHRQGKSGAGETPLVREPMQARLQEVPVADHGLVLFMQAARWPDDIRMRDKQYHRAQWHYINLPFKPEGQPAYVQIREPEPVNILTAMAENEGVVRGENDAERKAIALAWREYTERNFRRLAEAMICV